MLIHSSLLLLLSHLVLVHAASIVSQSQSYPLSHGLDTLGPKAKLVIANHNIAPDGFNRS
jgi:hypothetical protein